MVGSLTYFMNKAKEIFSRLNNIHIGLLVLPIIAGFLFYWYEVRPMNIKKECFRFAVDMVKEKAVRQDEGFNQSYQFCLKEKGI